MLPSLQLGRGYGVTINTVMAAATFTDMVPSAFRDTVQATTLPLIRAEERMGAVEDVADAVLLLTSEKSRWVTGQVISVSGGITGN